MASDSQQYRQRLKDVLIAKYGAKKPALLLSGGLDSGSALMACLDCGIEPDLFAITYGDHLNADAQIARKRAKLVAPHLPFEIIHVPRQASGLEQTALRNLARTGSLLKTTVEVMVMLYPVLDRLKADGFDAIFHGMTGGQGWGIGKEAMFEKSRSGEDAWMRLRRIDFGYEYVCYPPTSSRIFRQFCLDNGIVYMDPLEQIAPWLLTLSYKQMHSPKPKQIAMRAYPELAKASYIQIGMQMSGGVREFAQICAKEKGFTSAVAWYNQIAKQAGYNPRGTPQTEAEWRTGKCSHLPYRPIGL